MNINFELLISKLGSGMLTSFWIFGVTLLFSLPLGLVIAFGRMARNSVIRTITKIYFHHARNTTDAAADAGVFWTVLYL